MQNRILPSVDEMVYAISEEPLGMGEEAKVYKVHTSPDFAIRVSNDAPDLETLARRIFEEPFIEQEDIFGDRNYGQAIAYLPLSQSEKDKAILTVNLYVPGFSMEIHKPGRRMPPSEEALMKTLTLSKAVLNMPDAAIDRLFDDLHFLSSRQYSIDVGNAGFFANMGNILYSGVDKEFRIIDIQPFLRERVGIPQDHTKGFNTPYYLLRGLMPGAYGYRQEQSRYPELIDYRTEIVDKVISGAERNHLNDIGGYLRGDMPSMALCWKHQLSTLLIDEKYQDEFVKRICSVKQENRYPIVKDQKPLVRVFGYDMEI